MMMKIREALVSLCLLLLVWEVAEALEERLFRVTRAEAERLRQRVINMILIRIRKNHLQLCRKAIYIRIQFRSDFCARKTVLDSLSVIKDK